MALETYIEALTKDTEKERHQRPKKYFRALETYIEVLTKDTEKELHQTPKKYYRDNLMKDEREALLSLRT